MLVSHVIYSLYFAEIMVRITINVLRDFSKIKYDKKNKKNLEKFHKTLQGLRCVVHVNNNI